MGCRAKNWWTKAFDGSLPAFIAAFTSKVADVRGD
jgi:hypothetical protein